MHILCLGISSFAFKRCSWYSIVYVSFSFTFFVWILNTSHVFYVGHLCMWLSPTDFLLFIFYSLLINCLQLQNPQLLFYHLILTLVSQIFNGFLFLLVSFLLKVFLQQFLHVIILPIFFLLFCSFAASQGTCATNLGHGLLSILIMVRSCHAGEIKCQTNRY